MNTPLLLTSVALLAGVAARPIENDRRGENLRELVRSADNDEGQAFLGRIPSAFNSLNSLQLHETNDTTYSVDDAEVEGDVSPKLTGGDSPSDPDPGLDSPYLGPQQDLAGKGQELGPLTPTLVTATSSSTPARRTEQPCMPGGAPEYSSEVVALVFSSLAAIVLLGLAIAVVCVSQLLRRMVLNAEVWRRITSGRGGERGGVNWPEKEQYGAETLVRGGRGSVIAAREVSRGELSPSQSDPADMPLETVAVSSAPAVRDMAVGLWMYDNWAAHLMMALFSWLGMFFRR